MGDEASATDVVDRPVKWAECEDIRVLDDTGEVIYAGPKWMRCTRMECQGLVTHGKVRRGGCECGQRRVVGAWKLTEAEQDELWRGVHPLLPWEYALIHGQTPEQIEAL